MKIRPATNDDFDAILAIATATSSTDSLWNMLMPRAAFKDAAFKEHISQLLKQYIDPENKDWLVTVVELPDKDITPGAPHVASFAIWDMTSTSNSANKSAVESDNIAAPAGDSSKSRYLTRFITFNNAMSEGRSKSFKAFNKFMYLKAMATHPEYEGEGYAKALLRAGYEIARKNEAAVTVFAGPRGYVFFSGLGFADRGPLLMQSGGDEVNIKAMSFDPTNERRRSSVMESFMHYITS
jgi:ribosomal protein S18 acetylase RimI-like enzyme